MIRRTRMGLVALGLAAAHPVSAQPYSPEVLQRAPALPQDSLEFFISQLEPWLEDQREGISPEAAVALREPLYRVIQTLVQEESLDEASNHRVAMLFDWASSLGVFGAGLVAADLAPDEPSYRSRAVLPEPPFTLTYERPLFTLTSENAWRIRFPFYFMPWAMGLSPEMGEGEFVALSTLHGPSEPQASQATILIVGVQGEDPSDLLELWRPRLGIPESANCDADDWPIEGVGHACHSMERINVETGVVRSQWGSLLLVFSGLEGTFEANRSHFLALLAGL